jgi:hypothetical protein
MKAPRRRTIDFGASLGNKCPAAGDNGYIG